MRKVLHRSFKPAKCKITLQMATSRLKILKNKKNTQIIQLRREVAQLLESGQTQTAKIRVEHVVREEKTVAAYEFVGIYCELLVARLGVIDSQKDCPTDLKEAVASVLYATKQLSDVTELSDIVKHFTAKYGKDFVSAAVGLQPNSGVSRLLVEKLSAKAPDGPTKIKFLTEIAKEHNVTWEAESLVESDPKETVLSTVASSSQPVSGINSESVRISDNQPPEFQAPATVNVPQNSYAIDGRSSSHTTSTDVNIGKTADVHHQDPRPSGDQTDGRDHRHPNPSYGDSSLWETEFVDATSAARAAAESAERASFAARAAAELSSKERMMMMQNSSESHNSSSYDTLRNEPPHRHNSSSNKKGGGFTTEELLSSSSRQEDQSTAGAEASKKSVDELSENASWWRGHSRENSVEMRTSDSFAKIARDKRQPSMDDINLSCSEDVLIKKQSSGASSPSHSRNYSDENNITTTDHTETPSIWEESHIHHTFEDAESHNHDPDHVVIAPAFDDYSSFFDKPQFDTEDVYHEEPNQGLGFSLLGSSSKTPDHMSTETNLWSSKGHKSPEQPSSVSTSQILEQEKPGSPLFDDGPPLSLHEPEPSAKFDDYDRGSESEEDDLRNQGKPSTHVEEDPKLTSHKSSVAAVPDDLGRYFFPSDEEDQGDDSKTQEKSDVESPIGHRFGTLAGEIKNENTPPTYEMSPPRDKTSSKSVKYHVSTEVDPARSSLQTVSSSSIRKELPTQEATITEKRPISIPHPSSSDDESEMEPLERVSVRSQDKRTESRTRPLHHQSRDSHEDYEQKIPTRVSTRSSERTHKTTPAFSSASYLHSVSSDDEDEKEVRRGAARIQTKPTNSRLSRRTKGQERKASPVTTRTDKVSHDQESPPELIPEANLRAKQQVSASSSSFLPETNNAFHGHESPPKVAQKAKPLAMQEGPASYSSSLPKPEKVSHYRESPPKRTPETKSQAKQEISASSSSSLPKTVTSPDPETPVKEKASHVHPKLPDYDDIFAKLGALRR